MENTPSDGSPNRNSTNKKIKKQTHLRNFGFKSIVKITGKTHTQDTVEGFATNISFGCDGCRKTGVLTSQELGYQSA